MSVATGIGPCDLLAAPPQVFTAIVELLEEQAAEQDARDRAAKLKAKAGGVTT